MILLISFLFIAAMAGGFVWPIVAINRHNKKVFSRVPQSAIDSWGRTPLTELEEWWEDNQSKDAEISELRELISRKSALIATQIKEIQRLQNPQPIRRGHDEYIQIPTPTFMEPGRVTSINYPPGKVTPLPSYLNPATPIAGIRVEGVLAEAVMSDDTITTLKVRKGNVVEWSTESFNQW